MISRRGLFRLLGGLAASPVLKPLAALALERNYVSYRITFAAGLPPLETARIRVLPSPSNKLVSFYTYMLPERSVETL